MARRAEFTRSTKLAAWERDRGRCVHCGKKLGPGDSIEYDHRIRNEIKPDNSLANCDTLCGPCHAFKTHKVDAPAAAKSRSVRAAYAGAKPTPRQVMPGSRASKWRKPLHGPAVLRNGG